MAKLFQLLCLIAFASAQLDYEDDEPENLFDNTLTRTMENALFGDNVKTITIFSDFNNPADQFFFQNVLPWLVDQIGQYLRINYRFRNSARSAGPRACALRGLRTNTFLQAELLRCESRGTSISNCINQAPIDRRSYNRCVNRRIHGYVRNSQWDWDRVVSDQTPLIVMGNNREIPTNDPVRLLRLICQDYGRTKPMGCSMAVQMSRSAPVPSPALVSVPSSAPATIRISAPAPASFPANNFTSRNNIFDNMDAIPVSAGTNIYAMPYRGFISNASPIYHYKSSTLQLCLQFVVFLTGLCLTDF